MKGNLGNSNPLGNATTVNADVAKFNWFINDNTFSTAAQDHFHFSPSEPSLARLLKILVFHIIERAPSSSSSSASSKPHWCSSHSQREITYKVRTVLVEISKIQFRSGRWLSLLLRRMTIVTTKVHLHLPLYDAQIHVVSSMFSLLQISGNSIPFSF